MFFLILLGVGILSWGYADAKDKEEFKKYKVVYIGWLDLGEDNFATYGYATKEEWAADIKGQNVNGLQKYAKDYLKSWEVKGAAAKNEVLPKDPAILVVKFINAAFSLHSNTLRTGLQFCDGATGDVLKQVTVEPLMVNFNPFSSWSNMSFTGRVSQAMYNLAYDINFHLTN
ncbi:MAG: hypothetical protein C0407_10510 [Desulfobacca sp.]|nr:hypothetical protein [Desulfobacca sp.]